MEPVWDTHAQLFNSPGYTLSSVVCQHKEGIVVSLKYCFTRFDHVYLCT